MGIKKKYTNKFNRTQIVEVLKTKGRLSICKNDLGKEFFAVTKGLKDL